MDLATILDCAELVNKNNSIHYSDEKFDAYQEIFQMLMDLYKEEREKERRETNEFIKNGFNGTS